MNGIVVGYGKLQKIIAGITCEQMHAASAGIGFGQSDWAYSKASFEGYGDDGDDVAGIETCSGIGYELGSISRDNVAKYGLNSTRRDGKMSLSANMYGLSGTKMGRVMALSANAMR